MYLKHPESCSPLSRGLSTAINHLITHGLQYSAAALWREIWFDLVHGVDTTTPQFSVRSPHSIPYQGADPRTVKEALNSLPARARSSTFVDFGCGKGRALLLALQHGFQEVIGVEIAPELASICRRNLSAAACSRDSVTARLIEADATTFEPPPGPVTAFFFNPFHGPPLEQVASNLVSASRRSGSEAWLIYINPLHLEPFLTRGFKIVRSLGHRQTRLAVVAHLQPESTPE